MILTGGNYGGTEVEDGVAVTIDGWMYNEEGIFIGMENG